MFRPLAIDIAGFLMPILIGAASYFAGRSIARMSRWALAVLFLASAVVLIVALIAMFGNLPPHIEEWISRCGGPTVFLCCAALFLIGVARSQPHRSLSAGFLATITILALTLLVVESSGRLMWRFVFPETWQRKADPEGRLQQSSGITCSPAVAVMLSYAHGVESSEGELAYLAETTLLGTDAQAIARALNAKAESRGLRASVERLDFKSLQQHLPAIVHVVQPTGHALLVRSVTEQRINVHDPLSGTHRSLSRSEFESVWDGTVIWLKPL